MLYIPKRHSLVTETTNALRAGIHDGVWQGFLPGERSLCKQLHVSRPTLRSAFDVLDGERLIAVSPGKRRKIVSIPQPVDPSRRKVLGIIATQRMDRIAPLPLQMIMDLRYQLAHDGFESEVFVCPEGEFRKYQRKLEAFIRENSIFCCILMLSSREQQVWFHESGIRAFVLGSPHPSVPLPSLDVDYYAACRHAAGMFLGRGHRHVTMIRRDGDVAGDDASERGFLDGVANSGHQDARCSIIRHNGESRDLCLKIDRLFARPDAPTALMICKPLEVLITLMHLLHEGISVPGRVAVVSRDRDYIFECLRPAVAHYDFAHEVFSQKLTRLMLTLVEEGSLPPRRNLLMPRFVDGGTVGSGPASG